jgi:tetratricopeptide (TPR) repeat protein
MDANNPVVKLCAAGIGEEMAGRRDEAAKLYRDAWDARTNDYEACIAAHYVARLQSTPHDVLHWNSEALRFALSAGESELSQFFPSLYLNLGKSYEDLKNLADAKRFYLLAEEAAGVLSDGEYAATVKRGIRNALDRVTSGGETAAAQGA